MLIGMEKFELSVHSHRRYNPLSEGWVLVSPHRSKRPWLGQQESQSKERRPDYDPKCFLCPRNTRASGIKNPDYDATYIFGNDFSAVLPDQEEQNSSLGKNSNNDMESRFFKFQNVKGQCYVICFSPRHNLTIPEMSNSEIVGVVIAWRDLFVELMNKRAFDYVQIFENKGATMGCSNPHPHGQAWCVDYVPTEVSRELSNMVQYHDRYGTQLLGDYVQLELQKKVRIVLENGSFLVVVPYWAMWPFETLLMSKQHLKSLKDFNSKQIHDLATIMKTLTIKYDNLFETSFPYSMGLHQSPFEELPNSWFHIHFYPPLLRSATVKKFSVGFEMLAEPQRDLTPEQCARQLKLLSDIHYLNK